MKKLVFLLMACLLMLGASAYALTLPQEVASVFETDGWKGWTPVAADASTAQKTPGRNAAVIMQRNGRSVLCMLTKAEDGYVVGEQTAMALYQGDMLPELLIEEDIYFTLSYSKGANGTAERYSYFYNDNTQQWWMQNIGLNGITISYMQTNIVYFDGSIPGAHKAYGAFPKKLANFNINDFYRNYDDASVFVLPPPTLAEGEQQDPLPEGKPAEWTDAPSPVWTGPAAHYLQAEGAEVRQGDAVTVIGAEGSALFITYSGEGEGARYGYVPLSDDLLFPITPELYFQRQSGSLLEDCPLYSAPGGEALLDLAEGEPVFYLATLGGEYSYIETTGATPARGFVPSRALYISTELPDIAEGAQTKAHVTREVDVVEDPYRYSVPPVLMTIPADTEVFFVENFGGGWTLIEVKVDGETISGYVPKDALASDDPYATALERNG